jgi:predicted metal-dependent peptidase
MLIGMDVSGSVSSAQLAKGAGIVNNVMDDVRPSILYLVQCDADVQKVDELHDGEYLPTKIKVKGRGGTDMRPIWEWAKDKDINAAIIFSDFEMGPEYFGEKQRFPVLWVTCSRDLTPPWGQTARLEHVE